MASPRGVKVLFSPVGVIADDVIRELVAAEPAGRVVVVVTEDRELADDVRRAGARVVGARRPRRLREPLREPGRADCRWSLAPFST